MQKCEWGPQNSKQERKRSVLRRAEGKQKDIYSMEEAKKSGMLQRRKKVGKMREGDLLKYTSLENAMIIFNILSANLKMNT